MPGSGSPLTILVVDDIQASRHALCALVVELGHVPVGAASGADALEIIAVRRIDVVLLDLLMPGMDGFEVTRRIRATHADRWLPIVATSSFRTDEHFIFALENGADDFLTRPVNAALLTAKLRQYRRVLDLQGRLRGLAQLQRRIHDNILDAVITCDADGRILEANLAAEQAFADGTRRGLRGRDCRDVLGADLAALRSGGDVTLHRSDGTRFPARIGASEWDDDDALRYTLVVRDLTEQRRVERMKDEFVATVSHELRTPLTSVLGALTLLASGATGPLPETARPLAEAAERNGRRLSRLIDDILDLAKLEGNRLELRARRVRIGDLLREAQAANEGYAERAGVEIRLQADPEAAMAEVDLDGDRFLQVMANLVSNAIKHSPIGSAVTVSLEVAEHELTVRVRDHGPGVDAAFRSRLFSKFSQADGSDQRARGGAGLGLYISRMLVERMGGSIGAEDAPGGGSVFSVTFPRAGRQAVAARPWALVVDQDADARRRVATWLDAVCDVEAVPGLAQAAQVTRRTRPGMVLADTHAQGDADVFCGELQRLAAPDRVILYSDSVTDAFAQRVGAAWLRKSGSGRDDVVRAARDALRVDGAADAGPRAPAQAAEGRA
ncbi:MAG: ATP-binding protein [Burkholderiales bacterium]